MIIIFGDDADDNNDETDDEGDSATDNANHDYDKDDNNTIFPVPSDIDAMRLSFSCPSILQCWINRSFPCNFQPDFYNYAHPNPLKFSFFNRFLPPSLCFACVISTVISFDRHPSVFAPSGFS
jgi:hypothetical protein